jgi:hypothetical protein
MGEFVVQKLGVSKAETRLARRGGAMLRRLGPGARKDWQSSGFHCSRLSLNVIRSSSIMENRESAGGTNRPKVNEVPGPSAFPVFKSSFITQWCFIYVVFCSDFGLNRDFYQNYFDKNAWIWDFLYNSAEFKTRPGGVSNII